MIGRRTCETGLLSILLLLALRPTLCGGAELLEDEVCGLVGNAASVHAGAVESYSCDIFSKVSEKRPFKDCDEVIRLRLETEIGHYSPDRIVEDYGEGRYKVFERPKQKVYRADQETITRRIDSSICRLDEPQPLFQAPERSLADGERFYNYSTSPHYGRGATGLWIHPYKRFRQEGIAAAPEPMEWFSILSHDLALDVGHFYRVQKKMGPRSCTVKSTFDEKGDIVVRATGVSSGKDYTDEYAFSRECDFLPIRHENGNRDEHRLKEVTWQKIAKNGREFFFPSRTILLIETRKDGKLVYSIQVEMEFTNVKINEDIPDEKFTLEDLKMNADTEVIDKVAGKNYTLGFSGLVKNLTPSKSMIDNVLRDVKVADLGLDGVTRVAREGVSTPTAVAAPKETPRAEVVPASTPKAGKTGALIAVCVAAAGLVAIGAAVVRSRRPRGRGGKGSAS